MVGEDQAVGGDERAGAAVIETDGGEARMVEPSLGEFEAVFGLDLRGGRKVVEPHTLVGASNAEYSEDRGRRNGDEECAMLHNFLLHDGPAAHGDFMRKTAPLHRQYKVSI